ncbi:uncharacterized protein PAN0_001c0559 [Moesziomyces antarcticus]|uniref:Uncharacterized protein n=1 Tax=Pseudozyma antarctica TaxID=84753 RepID=A0A5C3FET2_PSEA2|nr:uncharacterized protein PAN0_001c0559 [Moesziomyces antarcticus]GAK62359.1 conserved hypothetical protein [Moesziomyces antarcticus]SPO42903.1 uncharacterized protein PSANT_00587 [Moesziomyces antarcticus]
MPSLTDLENFIEENLPRNLQELPHKVSLSVQEYYQILYEQLNKYGPPIPDLPSFPSFESFTGKVTELVSPIPPPPPVLPPPPPPTNLELIHAWTRRHRSSLSFASGLIIVGLGTSYAYRAGYIALPYLGKKHVVGRGRKRQVRLKNGVRREAVIVLGADTPLGRSLALHFSSQGFVVLASVSSSAALAQFENLIPPSSRGYVKALIFDVAEPSSTLQPFVRALSAALSLRYPLTSAGDPYARPGENISIAGVVNALSFVAPEDDLASSRSMSSSTSTTSLGVPISKLSPSPSSELLERHVVSSLCVLGALVPMLRALPNRAEDSPDMEPATIVTLVSSPASRTALPRQAMYSVIAQSVAAGVQSLRRECEEDSFHSKTASNSKLPPNLSASTAGGASARRASSSRSQLKHRDVRVTMVEVNAGSVWGEPAATPSANLAEPSASTMSANSSLHSPSRPSFGRSPSSSLGSLWHHRSPTSAPVLNKVSDLLLSTKRRLRPSYTVGTHTFSAYWLTLSQVLLTVVPTSVVDFALALRRQLSLRRAGLVGRAEHAFLPWNWGKTSDAGKGVRRAGEQRPAGSGPGPGPASAAHSRASLLRSNADLKRPAAAGYEIRDSDVQSLPESERSSGAGSGIPSSVPSSAYGDNDADADAYAGEESPYFGSTRQMHASHADLSASNPSLADAPVGGRAGGVPASFAREPWMGPPSSSGASSRLAHSPAVQQHSAHVSESEDRDGATDSPLGTSWVALGDSQHSHRS